MDHISRPDHCFLPAYSTSPAQTAAWQNRMRDDPMDFQRIQNMVRAIHFSSFIESPFRRSSEQSKINEIEREKKGLCFHRALWIPFATCLEHLHYLPSWNRHESHAFIHSNFPESDNFAVQSVAKMDGGPFPSACFPPISEMKPREKPWTFNSRTEITKGGLAPSGRQQCH
jgi:hypothetical protein